MSMNWEKYVSYWEKWLWTHYEFRACGWTFGLMKGPEWKHRLFDALPKQTTRQMKTLQVQVYIQKNDFIKNKELNLCKF